MLVLQIIVAIIILAIAVGFGVKVNLSEEKVSVRPFPLVGGLMLLFVWIFAVMPAFGQVPAGHRGVVLKFGGVTGEVLSEGLYIVPPFVNSVVLMDVSTQAYPAKAVDAASKDLQTVHTDVVVNYHLDPLKVADIYRNLRQDYQGRIISPAVEEVVKATTSRYEAEKLVTERTTVKSGIDNTLEQRLNAYGIVVDAVSITNFAFSKEFEQSIEAKVVAEQNALKAANDLVRIKTEAEQRIAQAEAEAKAIKLQAEALSDTPKLVELEAVRKWDGKLPQNMYGGSVPFVQVPAAK